MSKRRLVCIGVASVLLGAGPEALAQSSSGEPDRTRVARRKPLKRPVVNLERQAAAQREGQVVPRGPAAARDAGAPGASPTGAPDGAPAEGRDGGALRPSVIALGGAEEAGAPAPAPVDSRLSTSVRVARVDGSVQWREADRRWESPSEADSGTGRIEVRTGPGSSVTLVVAGGWAVQLGPLSRATLSRGESGEERLALLWGEALMDPAPDASALVLETPEGARGVQERSRARTDAFSGVQVMPEAGE